MMCPWTQGTRAPSAAAVLMASSSGSSGKPWEPGGWDGVWSGRLLPLGEPQDWGDSPPSQTGLYLFVPPRYLLEQVKRREGFQLVMEVGIMLECGMGNVDS